ncbi:hypothetical protein [Ructibacterium gallinarum]|nr:hypothetical protein [Ructibacterium gallinarum]
MFLYRGMITCPVRAGTEIKVLLNGTKLIFAVPPPLGKYTFTIYSADCISRKTIDNSFDVNFTDYQYQKQEFQSMDDFMSFIFLYGILPQPDRMIDAVIYAEKNLLTSLMILSALVEIMATPYLAQVLVKRLPQNTTMPFPKFCNSLLIQSAATLILCRPITHFPPLLLRCQNPLTATPRYLNPVQAFIL